VDSASLTDACSTHVRSYGPTLHRREEREVKRGKGVTAKVRNMLSGTLLQTCTCEEGAKRADECYSPMNDPSTTRTLVALSNAPDLNILNGVLPTDQRFFCLPHPGFEETAGYGWYADLS
jgi:hypothetical protein